MIFLSLIIFIMCKALINGKLSEDFYQRISAIILLFAGILSYNCLFISVLGNETCTVNYNIDLNSGIGIYGGFFHITNISQMLELFLLIIFFSGLYHIILNYHNLLLNLTFINLKHYTTIFLNNDSL